MTEQELVIDLPVDGPAVRNPKLVEGKRCSTLIGGLKKLQGQLLDECQSGCTRIKSDPTNESILIPIQQWGIDMQPWAWLCGCASGMPRTSWIFKSLTHKFAYFVAWKPIRAHHWCKTWGSGKCLLPSWGGNVSVGGVEMTWVSKIQPMNQWFSSQMVWWTEPWIRTIFNVRYIIVSFSRILKVKKGSVSW